VSPIAIVGLGNPGSEYSGTRHNAGYWLLDEFARKLDVSWKDKPRFHSKTAIASSFGKSLILVKSGNFMNCSGEYLKPLLDYHKCVHSETIVIHDDTAFTVGQLKLSCNRGHGGHNGVKDIIRAIGSDFVRFRLGVGMKKDSRMDLADHVLSRLTTQEVRILADKTDFFLCTLREVLDKGCAHAMNSVNQTT
jgi:PTH1 family peptidyl-tRNA hydrolase